MKNPSSFIFFFVFIACFNANAQKRFNHSASIGWQTHYGSYLSQSPKADYIKDSYTFFNELYYQQQTSGSKEWQQVNNGPQWGVAFFWGGTGSKKYMGHMMGAYPFATIPLYKTNRFASKLRGGMGLGWVQHPYDKATNHKNVLIGRHLNGYIGFLWQNELRIFQRLYASAGFSFTHLSNGGSTLPNLGLNVPAVTFGLRYGAPEVAVTKTFKKPFDKRGLQYRAWLGAGIKQAPWIESKRYGVKTLAGEVSKQLGYSSAVSGGAVLYHDKSLEVHPLGIPSLKRKGTYLQAGVYAAYEHHLGKLSIPLQLGTYVWNKDKNPQLFQNIGMRYKMGAQWNVQVLLKTHMGQADHLQAGIGYRFKQ